jgi:Tol biopolymer transport system component
MARSAGLGQEACKAMRLRWVFIGLGLLACSDRAREWQVGEAIPFDRVSVISWLDDDRILFSRVAAVLNRDVLIESCDSTGLYTVSVSGEMHLLRQEDSLCRVLASSEELALSPSGSSLLYAKQGTGEIRLYNMASGVDSLLQPACFSVPGAPKWSPDGQWIAFAAQCDDEVPKAVMSLMSVATGRVRPLALSDSATLEDSPSWAPAGDRIALRRGAPAWRAEVLIADRESGRRTFLTRGFGPSWSPTGEWIAFARMDSPGTHAPSLWRIRPGGRDEQLIVPSDSGAATRARWPVGPAVWSPAGDRLAFGGGGGVWIVNSDGSGLHAVVTFATQRLRRPQ